MDDKDKPEEEQNIRETINKLFEEILKQKPELKLPQIPTELPTSQNELSFLDAWTSSYIMRTGADTVENYKNYLDSCKLYETFYTKVEETQSWISSMMDTLESKYPQSDEYHAFLLDFKKEADDKLKSIDELLDECTIHSAKGRLDLCHHHMKNLVAYTRLESDIARDYTPIVPLQIDRETGRYVINGKPGEAESMLVHLEIARMKNEASEGIDLMLSQFLNSHESHNEGSAKIEQIAELIINL